MNQSAKLTKIEQEKQAYDMLANPKKEGRRLKSLEPMAVVMPFIMPTRIGAQDFYRDSIPLDIVNSYVHQKRNTLDYKNLGIMHVIIAAYVRMISQRPGMNRFVRGLRVFARNNIEINLAVKKSMQLDSPETMIKFFFTPNDTLFDVYSQMDKKISEYCSDSYEDSAFDTIARIFGYLPNFLLRGIVSFLKFLDYFGRLPRFLTRLSPFHGSMVITSMGSLGIQPIFHHLYNFGNVPVFVAFSTGRHAYELKSDGEMHKVRYLDFTVSVDERICDGFYFSSSFHEVKKYLKNPHLLEDPPTTVVKDIP